MDWLAMKSACSKLGIDLSDDQLHQFEAFEAALYRANEVMNLTRVPREECWLRHFVDSLLVSEWIEDEASVLDIGTGPGFPAWPIACARPSVAVVGMDSSSKMLGFLALHKLPNLKMVNGRAEDRLFDEYFDVVTGRAVAPLGIQMELSVRPARVGGSLVLMRSIQDREQIEGFPAGKLGLKLESVETRLLPGTDVERVFPIFRKIKPTPGTYPRSWADIKRSPLGATTSKASPTG